MCGIVGYWNSENPALDVVVDSLKRLEYRGYDSFGVGVVSDNSEIKIEKQVGKISDAKCNTEIQNSKGTIGLGHTRWATHGKVTEKNTHPHLDCKKRFIIVHNGIIENSEELKSNLKENHNFLSETDTEIIPHLIEEIFSDTGDLKQSIIKTGNMLKGRNAFVVLDSVTGKMIAFRNGSPLIVGVKKSFFDSGNPDNSEEVFVASDIQAFLHKTKDVMYLDDNQIAIIKKEPEFFDAKTGEKIEKRLIKIDVDASDAEKGDYSHFMLKEIMEQKETLIKAINQNEDDLKHVADEINNAKGVFFIGCGTAARVCHTAEYVFSKVADKHINYIPASEFQNYKDFLLPETLVIAVSQSGETADVLEALSVAKQKGSKIISITNVKESSIARTSDYTFLINAGPEKAVASTKATTSQIVVAVLLAYASAGKLNEGYRILSEISGKVNDMLNPRYSEHIKNIAEKIYEKKDIFIIGRGFNYPMALESAIKIMEVSYIHSQGFAGGELKHGPLALIEEGTPVLALFSNDLVKGETISNASEVKARGAQIIGIGPENNDVFDYWIKTPEVPEECSPIVNLIPVQLLAYYLGILKGYDVDYPRSLAKSVTVK